MDDTTASIRHYPEGDHFSLSPHFLLLKILYLFIYLFIFSGSAAQRGLWPPRPRGFVTIHNDAPQSVGLLWTSDQLVAETST
jgi:hypothetical protein